jgi:hypothetical protein
VSVAGRAGDNESLTLVLKATIHGSRGALHHHADLQAHGTTGASGFTAANNSSVHPYATHRQPQPATNLRGPRCANGAAMLTCGFAQQVILGCSLVAPGKTERPVPTGNHQKFRAGSGPWTRHCEEWSLTLVPWVDNGCSEGLEVQDVAGREGGASGECDPCDLAVADFDRSTAALSCCDSYAGRVRSDGVEGKDATIQIVTE